MERIGDRIGKLMKIRGYSQKELASLVDVTEGAMSRYLKNDREPKIDTVARMAVALHTTTDYLIRGEENVSGFDEVYETVVNGVEKMSDKERLMLIKALTI